MPDVCDSTGRWIYSLIWRFRCSSGVMRVTRSRSFFTTASLFCWYAVEISARFTSVSWSTAVCALCVVPTCYRVGGELYRIYAVDREHAHRRLERLELLLLLRLVGLYLLRSLGAGILQPLHAICNTWYAGEGVSGDGPVHEVTGELETVTDIGGPAARPSRPPSRLRGGSGCSVTVVRP